MSALEDYADVIEVADPERLSLYERENDNLALSEARIGKAVTALTDELESLQADAALGALVRRMPELAEPDNHFMVSLTLYWPYSTCWDTYHHGKHSVRYDTPEAALREALKEQDE